MHESVVIVSAVRTPIGKFGGSLLAVSAPELGALVIRESLQRAELASDLVDEVYMGCVLQTGLGQNVARQATLKADLPVSVPATTVNIVCGSGLKSVHLAALSILAGEADIVVAGGMENMSAAPYVLDQARFGYRMNNGTLKDAMLTDALWDAFHNYHMGITAENIVSRFGITREEQDAFAAQSQQKCEAARRSNAFADEIVPVTIHNKKGDVLFCEDESPRDSVTQQSISHLKSTFKQDGTVTAGNSSGINDGAAAVVLMRESKAKELGIRPLARYVCGTTAGVEPAYMGLGAAEAAIKLMRKIGITANDLALIEANEAFAAQSIACAKFGGWDSNQNEKKVNINGGAIALGHPVGASGCRILVTLIHALRKKNGGLGLATLCVGGGMGVSALIEV